MREMILRFFRDRQAWNIKELEIACKLHSSRQFTELVKTLNQLEEEKVLWNDHSKYVLLDDDYFVGKVKNISKAEFAVIASGEKRYVKKKKASRVFEGDEVLVHGGEIVHTYRHTVQNISGTFVYINKELKFRSDIDYHCSFRIKNIKCFHIRPKTKAVVEIVRYGNPLEVNIVQLLGHSQDPGVDITSKLYENNIRQSFNAKIQNEVKHLPGAVTKEDARGRVDYRDQPTITIDGDDAKDFDDAISIERKENSYRLSVHIADVSHYVKENSAIDKEAYARGTSVYVTDRVVPMLPFALSNGICSLNPNVDRCTLSCVMEIDAGGHCTSYKIQPTLIHSDRRCTYKKVNAFLHGDADAVEEYSDISELIYDLNACTKQLRNNSLIRGKVDFSTKESIIQLNKKGKAVHVEEKLRGWAEEMIEECMILANVCVAHHLHVHHLPCMYRIHERPDPEKMVSICTAASAMHIPFDFHPEDVQPKQLQQFLESISDKDAYLVLSMVALRSMQKAKYHEQCKGHYGLALDEYCHFTSPIRRYPDLMVHRMLRKYIFEGHRVESVDLDVRKIQKQSIHVSQKEREAIAVERQISDMKKAEYMETRIGRRYQGTVVGVQRFGFFVELENTVEGMVPLHTLYDFYDYDEQTMSLKGQATGHVIHMGQRVEVLCTHADRNKGQIEFAMVQ